MSEQDEELLGDSPSYSGGGQKKYNFAELFMKLQEGDNVLRIVSTKGKSAQTLWIQDINKKWNSVKMPATITPSTQKGLVDKGAGKPIKKNFAKVVDSFGKLRILEFGNQISKGLKKIQNDLLADGRDITSVDIIIHKGPKKSNPLYEVSRAKLDADEKALRDKAIKRLVEADEIVLADIIKPWSEKRIREQILGITDEATSSKPAASNNSASSDDDEDSVEVSDDAFADMEKD
jgi:hypothetical protein